MPRDERNRGLRRVGLASVVVILGVGVWQGVAGATTTSGKTAKIEFHNENCGHTIGTPSIGTATYSRSGNTVNVKFDIESGNPNDDYDITLWVLKNGGDCKQVADMGVLDTDSSGRARGEFSAQVDPKSASFFATGQSSSTGSTTTRCPSS